MRMEIKGVNLGNWLVLEKWMSPALFEGTTAEDEDHLPRQLSKEIYEARIRVHRSEYISERDFVSIKRMGMNAVRIPVPYFLFGDRAPFVGCIKELDQAFDWAEKYGLKVLIDLHTVPLSQNGFDNGGLCGVCRWSQTPEEVDFVLQVLEKLAIRYGQREALLGIEPVNEPITSPMWERMDVPNRYPAADPEQAAGSAPITLEFLQDFYRKAYDRMRPHMAEEKYVVFHDGFQMKVWKEFLTQPHFRNVMLDTHLYLMMAEQEGCPQTMEGYLAYIEEHYARDIREVQAYIPVICGEWCLFNSYVVGTDTRGGQSALNGMKFSGTKESLTPGQKKEIYQTLADAQLKAWSGGSGYFYWSYKLLLDTAGDPNWTGWDCWDLGRCVDEGWFPKNSFGPEGAQTDDS